MRRHMLLILALSTVLAGCLTSQYNFIVKPPNADSTSKKINLSAGLQFSSEFCTYTHTSVHQGGKNIFKLGPTLCSYAKNVARDVFTSVAVAENGVFKSNVDVIIKPKISNVTVFYRTGVIPAKVESVILLEWNITDRNGNILYSTTVQGDGIDQRKYGLADVRYQTSMQNALDDLFNKSYREMFASPELRHTADKIKK
jgi:hypothetical protein